MVAHSVLEEDAVGRRCRRGRRGLSRSTAAQVERRCLVMWAREAAAAAGGGGSLRRRRARTRARSAARGRTLITDGARPRPRALVAGRTGAVRAERAHAGVGRAVAQVLDGRTDHGRDQRR